MLLNVISFLMIFLQLFHYGKNSAEVAYKGYPFISAKQECSIQKPLSAKPLAGFIELAEEEDLENSNGQVPLLFSYHHSSDVHFLSCIDHSNSPYCDVPIQHGRPSLYICHRSFRI
ncbi:MAG: hypothetical protein KGO81_13980 [Bacteroidota bacterium]|nr:hypothetical protein [Bacteroidota bacterium]